MKHGRGVGNSEGYLVVRRLVGEVSRQSNPQALVVFERGQPPDRPLPPFFAPVGGRDPLRADSKRLEAALTALGGECEAPVYPGGGHAFHAFVFRRVARRCWRDVFGFLERQWG